MLIAPHRNTSPTVGAKFNNAKAVAMEAATWPLGKVFALILRWFRMRMFAARTRFESKSAGCLLPPLHGGIVGRNGTSE